MYSRDLWLLCERQEKVIAARLQVNFLYGSTGSTISRSDQNMGREASPGNLLRVSFRFLNAYFLPQVRVHALRHHRIPLQTRGCDPHQKITRHLSPTQKVWHTAPPQNAWADIMGRH